MSLDLQPEEPDRAAGDVLRRHYGRVCSREEISAVTGGFSGAMIWRVETDAGPFALRRWPAGGLSRVRLEGLHELLRHLHQRGISVVPLPVPASGGATLVTSHGHAWQLEPWMPGVADFRERPSLERLSAAMTTLARVHVACERFVPRVALRAWFACRAAAPAPAVRERLQRLRGDRSPGWVEEALRRTLNSDDGDTLRALSVEVLQRVRRMHPVVRAELESAIHVKVRLHPCLRDVWHDHVLFEGADVTGLIDPAATRTEHVAADLSRLLGSLLGGERPRWWAAAVDEYARHRPLSAAERLLIRTLDQSGVLLSGLTWIDRRLQGRIRPQDQQRVRVRMESIAGRLLSLEREA